MKCVRSIAVTALASSSLAALVVAAPPASAQTGSLSLSLQPSLRPPTSVTLTCDPTGGTHPDGDAACADLTQAGGDISRIPPEAALCTANFDPVTALAQGTWLGRPISYQMDFSNACFANIETGGHVFHF